MGRVKTNPSTVLAIVRLPVELKEYAGKWAHIWRTDENSILIKFSESREVDEIFGVHFGVHQAKVGNIEERLRKLEMVVEDLKSSIRRNEVDIRYETRKTRCSGGDLNPSRGSESPA